MATRALPSYSLLRSGHDAALDGGNRRRTGGRWLPFAHFLKNRAREHPCMKHRGASVSDSSRAAKQHPLIPPRLVAPALLAQRTSQRLRAPPGRLSHARRRDMHGCVAPHLTASAGGVAQQRPHRVRAARCRSQTAAQQQPSASQRSGFEGGAAQDAEERRGVALLGRRGLAAAALVASAAALSGPAQARPVPDERLAQRCARACASGRASARCKRALTVLLCVAGAATRAASMMRAASPS
jgi:hypothetical protein